MPREKSAGMSMMKKGGIFREIHNAMMKIHLFEAAYRYSSTDGLCLCVFMTEKGN